MPGVRVGLVMQDEGRARRGGERRRRRRGRIVADGEDRGTVDRCVFLSACE